MRFQLIIGFLLFAVAGCANQPRVDEAAQRASEQVAREKLALAERLAAEETRLQAEREAEQNAQLAKAKSVAALSDWVWRIQQKVRNKVSLPKNIQGNPELQFVVEIKSNGEVVSVTMKKSSGNRKLDSAVKLAIHKASPLPLPSQADVLERKFVIQYRPYVPKK
jgi:colicin import membrane protein